MSIVDEVRADIKSAKKIWLPWWAMLTTMIAFGFLYVLLGNYGMAEIAIPAAMTGAVFSFIIYVKSSLINKLWFWATLCVSLIIHVLLLFYIPWTNNWVPAVATAFISSIDILINLYIIAFVKSLIV